MSINIISKGDIQLQGFNSELQNLLSTAEALDSNPSTASKGGITIVNEYADFFFTNLGIIIFLKKQGTKIFVHCSFKWKIFQVCQNYVLIEVGMQAIF